MNRRTAHLFYGKDFSNIKSNLRPSVSDVWQCAFNVSGFNSLCSLLGLFVLVPLDKPEEFLLQIHKMDHFAERLECWLTRNKFTETLTAIGKVISM